MTETILIPVATLMPTDQSTTDTPDMRTEGDLVDGQRDLLRQIAAKRVSEDAVDDVLQEVALAVVRSPSRPPTLTQVRHWLCAMTLRQCALFVRQSARQQKIQQRSRENESHSVFADDPIHGLLAAESDAQVRDALQKLDGEAEKLLRMKIVHGMTYAQMAEATGMSKHTVEYRVGAARRALRTEIIRTGLIEDENS